MRKTLLAAVLCALYAIVAKAQVTMSYDVKGTVGTYEEITGGTVLGSVVEGEEFDGLVLDAVGHTISEGTVTEGLPIGFKFKYDNKLMDRFVVGVHGYIQLGCGTVNVVDPSDKYNVISSGAGSDNDVIGITPLLPMAGLATTKISYKVVGEAPNRTLVVQYKDIGVNNVRWEQQYKAVQLQMRLHEDTGSIDIITRDWCPDNDALWGCYVKVGIKGTDDDRLMLNKSFSDFTLDTGTMVSIDYSNDSYPADGQTYTFTPPADCSAPAAQPTGLVLNPRSDNVSGSFTPSVSADHYLVLVSENATLADMPADGMTYAPGDRIGDAQVVAYDTLAAFVTDNGLKAASAYYIHVIAANSYCMFGAKYLTDSPLSGKAVTLPEAPGPVTVADAGFDAVRMSVEGNAAGDRILVGVATEPVLDQWDQIQDDGVFGTPDGSMTAGDEIPGGGKVAYIGAAGSDITVGGLEENTAYFIRVWSMGEDGICSSTYSHVMTATGGTVPYVPDFSKMPDYDAPAGWETGTDGFVKAKTYNGSVELRCGISPMNPENGVENYLVTPWIQLGEGQNRLIMDVNLTAYVGRVKAVYNNWEEGDRMLVQVSADGKEFVTVHTIDPATAPQMKDVSSFVTLRVPFDKYAGQKVKVRLYWKTYSNPELVIRNFLVEHKDDCDYPVNLRTVAGSVAGREAAIDWDRQGNENEWEMRAREAGAEEWGETVPVLSKPYVMAGLPSQTDMEVQLRAKCDAATHSPWSAPLVFRTGYTVPFAERFDGETAPQGWEPLTGELGSPTVFEDTEDHFWEFSTNFRLRGMVFSPNGMSVTSEWLAFPVLDLEDGSANYVMSLYVTSMNQGSATDAKYSILVSQDEKGTFGESDIVKTLATADMPESYESGVITVPLRGYKGKIRPAFLVSTGNGTPMAFKLDSVVVSPTCPADIAGIALTDITETSAKVAWTTNAEKSYVFIRKAGETVKPYVEQTETECEFTGLQPRTDYEIGITKVCEPGDTARVTVVRMTTLAAALCPQPENIAATAAKYGAVITWTGESQSYNLRYRKAGTSVWTERSTVERSYELTSLEQDTEYEYRIQAVCSTVEGDTSEYTPLATVRTLPETCFAPENISVTAGYNRADVTWSGEAGSYTLAYAVADGDVWTATRVAGNSYTIEGLDAETSYKLRMRSHRSETDSSQWGADVVFATIPVPECVTPTDLTVSELTSESVLLSWNADESNLRWSIHWRRSDVSAWTVEDGLEKTSYELTGLDGNASYIWSVMAECEAKNSKWAGQNKFTTLTSGIGGAGMQELAVFVKNRVLNIVNPEREYVARVAVYTESGQLLKDCEVKASENIFIPLGGISSQVLIVKITGKDCVRSVKTGI